MESKLKEKLEKKDSSIKIQTAEMYLCDYLGSSREELQYNISKYPTRVIQAMERFIKNK